MHDVVRPSSQGSRIQNIRVGSHSLSQRLGVMLFAATIGLAISAEATYNADVLNKATIPAFPGAEGAGAFTPGGRGGKVFAVVSQALSHWKSF